MDLYDNLKQYNQNKLCYTVREPDGSTFDYITLSEEQHNELNNKTKKSRTTAYQFISYLIFTSVLKSVLICNILTMEANELQFMNLWLKAHLIFDASFLIIYSTLYFSIWSSPLDELLYNNSTYRSETNITSILFYRIWSRWESINAILLMDNAERQYEWLLQIGEAVRLLYTCLFMFGNLLYMLDSDSINSNLAVSIQINLIMLFGYIFLIVPLSACMCYPLIIVFMCFIEIYQSSKGNAVPASEKIIDQLEQTTLGDDRISSEEEVCSICLAEFIQKDIVIILPCNEKHVFHDECIKNWLLHNGICPICRSNVEEALAHSKQNQQKDQKQKETSDLQIKLLDQKH